MKKALRWIAVSFGFIIAALLVVWAIMNAIWGAELRKTITEIKARGEPMTIAEIVPAYVPPEKNAVVGLNRAFALMCGDKPDEQYIPGKQGGKLKANVAALNDFYPKMKQASAEERKKNFDLIDSPEFTEIFVLLNAAALKTGYNSDLKYEDGVAMLLPNLSVFRASVKLLCLKAFTQADKGDIAGACDTLTTAIKVSNYLQNEPVLISQLVRMAGLQITAETLNNITDNFQIPEENAKRFIAELEKINITEPFKKSLIAERVVFGSTIFDGLISGKHGYDYFCAMLASEIHSSASRLGYFIVKIFIKKDYCKYLQIMGAYPKACDRPYYLSVENELKRIETDLNHSHYYCRYFHILSSLLIPNLTKIFERNAEFQTKLAISKIKLALVIYKGRHAAFPENLEQLKPEILKEIPIDELTGQPLTYKKEGDKYTLFSAALNELEAQRKKDSKK